MTLLLPRRHFLASSTLAAVAAYCRLQAAARELTAATLPIVDLHVHGTHRDRPDDDVIVHQRNTGIRTTVLLPAGTTGGLAAGAAGNEHCTALVRRHPERFVRFANENAFRPDAAKTIERELKAGAIGIGELKDKVACDSDDLERIIAVAREHDVPLLLHFQDGSYNDGFARFHRVLEKHPTVKFIGHATTFWAHIDRAAPASGRDNSGPVARGGLTDRWLADYPNLYGDLSAGSGNRALSRDAEFTQSFLTRHQDKLLYGSDCFCATGVGPQCLGATKLSLLRQFTADESILKKILFGNARKLLRLPPEHLV
jgi:predicted TIM-barrel fold metal-dependent hydrolase